MEWNVSISLEKTSPRRHNIFSDSSLTGDAVSLLKILPSLVFTGDAVSLLKIQGFLIRVKFPALHFSANSMVTGQNHCPRLIFY